MGRSSIFPARSRPNHHNRQLILPIQFLFFPSQDGNVAVFHGKDVAASCARSIWRPEMPRYAHQRQTCAADFESLQVVPGFSAFALEISSRDVFKLMRLISACLRSYSQLQQLQNHIFQQQVSWSGHCPVYAFQALYAVCVVLLTPLFFALQIELISGQASLSSSLEATPLQTPAFRDSNQFQGLPTPGNYPNPCIRYAVFSKDMSSLFCSELYRT